MRSSSASWPWCFALSGYLHRFAGGQRVSVQKAQLDLIEVIWDNDVWREDDAMTPVSWGQAHKCGGPSTAEYSAGYSCATVGMRAE